MVVQVVNSTPNSQEYWSCPPWLSDTLLSYSERTNSLFLTTLRNKMFTWPCISHKCKLFDTLSCYFRKLFFEVIFAMRSNPSIFYVWWPLFLYKTMQCFLSVPGTKLITSKVTCSFGAICFISKCLLLIMIWHVFFLLFFFKEKRCITI
jgi:hypothetical protein